MLRIAKGAAFAVLMISASVSGAADYPQPLPEEPVPTVTELPERYPASWIFVHDLHFNSLHTIVADYYSKHPELPE